MFVTYGGVTPELLERAKKVAADAGIPITGDSGIVERDGFKVEYAYLPKAQRVTLNVLKAPFPAAVTKRVARQRLTEALKTVGVFEVK